MKFLGLLLFGAGLSQAVPKSHHALIPKDLEKSVHPSCMDDNLYHTFFDIRYSLSASMFCGNFMAQTSVSIAGLKATITSYANVAGASSAVKSLFLATQILTNTSPGVAITVVPKATLQALPAAFAPGKAGTYPPDRISSACSCLVSPLVMPRQIVANTSTSTQNWTRHFTRLATTIEATTSTADGAATSFSFIPLESAPTTSLVAASTVLAAPSSSAASSNAALTTSVGAASSAALSDAAASSFAAASTSDAAASSSAALSDAAASSSAAASTTAVEQPPQASPAGYCTAGDFYGPVNGLEFRPLCGASYVPSNPNPNTLYTTDSYMHCAALCDGALVCECFSYLFTAAADNCYIADRIGFHFPDLNVDSGYSEN